MAKRIQTEMLTVRTTFEGHSRTLAQSAHYSPAVAEIRLATLGRLLAGDEEGRFVEVIHDPHGTGGYFVFTYADLEKSPPCSTPGGRR